MTSMVLPEDNCVELTLIDYCVYGEAGAVDELKMKQEGEYSERWWCVDNAASEVCAFNRGGGILDIPPPKGRQVC